MSENTMKAVFNARFRDIKYTIQSKSKKTGEIRPKKIRVLAATAKWVTVALADHANDEGEGAYPSIDKLATKTSLSRISVIAALKGLKAAGIITYAGTSESMTSSYTVNLNMLDSMSAGKKQAR